MGRKPFANMRSRCKEPSRNKAEAYRVYGEHLFRRSDAADALRFAKAGTRYYYIPNNAQGAQPMHSAMPADRTKGVRTYLYLNGERVAINSLYNTNHGQYYYGSDILGSVKFVTGGGGQELKRIEYDVFGGIYKGNSPYGLETGYTGKPYDSVTGLSDYGFRDYSPTHARFITEDPIRDGENWFAYVGNNPVNYIDPWGLEEIIVSGGIAGYENNRYNFIETAIKLIKYRKSVSNENITWLVAASGYTDAELKKFSSTAKKLNVSFMTFNDKEILIDYINSGKMGTRPDDKITLFSNFSHGGNVQSDNIDHRGLWFGYQGDYYNISRQEDKLDLVIQNIAQINAQAFNNPISLFYSCNTGSGGTESFAQLWVNHVGGIAQGATGLTSYYNINTGLGLFDKLKRKLVGYNEAGSINLPIPNYAGNSFWEYFSADKSDDNCHH